MRKKDALILVDLQNDFFPGGSLGVPGAHAIFPLANTLQTHFDTVIATKDWHPKNHGSFASNHPGHKLYDIVDLDGIPQVLWPDHCVQGSSGSEFHPELQTERIKKVIYKGTDPSIDSYSTFFDNAHRKSTDLDPYLSDYEIENIYLMGLATDYCVLYSALDAVKLGYNCYVIIDGCFGINKNPGDIEKAIDLMKQAGAHIIDSQTILIDKP